MRLREIERGEPESDAARLTPRVWLVREAEELLDSRLWSRHGGPVRTKWGCSCSGLAYLFEDRVVGLLLVCHVYLRGVPQLPSLMGGEAGGDLDVGRPATLLMKTDQVDLARNDREQRLDESSLASSSLCTPLASHGGPSNTCTYGQGEGKGKTL